MDLRRVWFPLRSNISFFETTGPHLDLASRVKEAALLADELIFEPGVLSMNITENGSSSIVQSSDVFDEERLRRYRAGAAHGSPFSLGIAKQSHPGEPAAGLAHTLVAGSLERGFLAEFEFSLRRWGLDGLDWVGMATLDQRYEADAKRLARQQRRGLAGDLRVSENTFFDSAVKDGLAIDLARGGMLRLPAAIDELHAPLLNHAIEPSWAGRPHRTATGAMALRVLVPDFSRLPWPDVIALHDSDAIGAFRSKLLEAEMAARVVEEAERPVVLRDFFISELADKLFDLMPTVRKGARDLAIDFVSGVVASGVPFAGNIIAAARTAGEIQRQRSEWTAVFMSLTRALG